MPKYANMNYETNTLSEILDSYLTSVLKDIKSFVTKHFYVLGYF